MKLGFSCRRSKLKGFVWLLTIAFVLCLSIGTVNIGTAKIADNGPLYLGLQAGETGTVARVIDGDSFVLTSGLKVSLSAIQAPKPAQKYGHTKSTKNSKGLKPAWPLANMSRGVLQDLTAGKRVKLFYGGDRRDRYDRAIAQVYTLDAQGKPDVWLQQAMVEAGAARVYSWQNYRQDTDNLYAAERAARTTERGIWNSKATNGFYDVRKPDPNPLAQYVDSVQIVEGFIVKSAEVRGTIYLNFGADYKTDFTIAIPKTSRRTFKKAGLDPKTDILSLTGARVRVRGYIELYGGPIIWLNDPVRLEILD